MFHIWWFLILIGNAKLDSKMLCNLLMKQSCGQIIVNMNSRKKIAVE